MRDVLYPAAMFYNDELEARFVSVKVDNDFKVTDESLEEACTAIKECTLWGL